MAVGYVKLVEDYRIYAHMVFNGSRVGCVPSVTRWSPPGGWVVYLLCGRYRYVAFGLLIRDSSESIVGVATKRIQGRWDADMAELILESKLQRN